ncbi:peptide deformylase [Novispirillum sp. DQ9]|uniref:peptide deformylase n=1 Tax=Novispirillum sp. DQ9 TaxID=3398612 RepID=UPI003C7EB34B
MALLPIIVAPDPRLKVKAKPVEKVDAEVARLMDDMLETMYAAPGVGLAAPQVGVARQVIVVDAADEGQEPAPLRMANPQIIWASDEIKEYEEGCLSVPEQYDLVKRPAEIKVRYLDHQNEVREIHADGLLAVVLQHEIDHLAGTLFVDHLSSLKRNMVLRRLTKAKKVGDMEAEWVPKARSRAAGPSGVAG